MNYIEPRAAGARKHSGSGAALAAGRLRVEEKPPTRRPAANDA